jgi:two-component system, OmpR family, alkaline phosphatase synthesis response regulator PhoP
MDHDSLKVLVVEDEPGLQQALADLLGGAGHRVEAVGDGEAAVRRGTEVPFDLVLLDLMLPRKNGVDVCRALREARPGLPIIVLTARGSEEDKVRGLMAGADDYVTKPFGARELLARVSALSRRSRSAAVPPEVIECDGCRFDLGRCIARRNGRDVHLTQREVGILRWLHLHRMRAVSRAELLEQVWGVPGDLQTRTVDMTISNLRHKIEADASAPRIVITVKGTGYAWGDARAN